jgi:hypothetical protein
MNRRNLLKVGGLALIAPAIHAEDDFKTYVDVASPYPPVPIHSEVRMLDGRPILLINGEPEIPMLYALTDCPGGRWAWEELPSESITNFVQQGFRLFQVDIWLSQMWDKNGVLDIELARDQLRGILRLKRDAAVFLRVHVNAPDWWVERHPGEITEFADTAVTPAKWFGVHRILDQDLDPIPQASLASSLWYKELGNTLADFCRKLSATPEGKCVAGLHVAGGVYGEWAYWAFLSHDPDIGGSMTNHFREWLQRKYGTDAALQIAWGNSKISFEKVAPPDSHARREAGDGVFRDPVRQQSVIDYFECQHQTVAEDIIHFCKIVKTYWPRPIIAGAFYGYYFGLFGREASGGHLEPETVFSSPFVDYVSGPQAYDGPYRNLGGTGQSRGMLESVRLHRKLWLDEMDQEPHSDKRHSLIASGDETASSMPDAIAILRRDVMQPMVHGMGLWFYDFGYANNSGWWNNPDLLKEIRAERKIFERYGKKEYRTIADVLVVFDTRVFYNLPETQVASDLVSGSLTNELTANMYHSGVVFDQVYLGDLKRVDMNRYKAVIFANTLCLTDAQKHWIQDNVAKDNRHMIWIYAPGFSDGTRLSDAFVRDVTGIDVQRVHTTVSPVVSVESTKLPASRFSDKPSVLNGNGPVLPSSRLQETKQGSPLNPLFVVTDTSAEIHGYLVEGHRPALAIKKYADYTTWFSTLPIQDIDVLRELLRTAGAHIYNDAGDLIHANEKIMLVHSKTGGERNYHLWNGKVVRKNLSRPSTILLNMVTGDILLGGENSL